MTPLDRKAWLRERQSGLGGTDISAICGIGFRTAQEVYAEKVGELTEDAALPIMRMGLALESHNADIYSERFLGPDDALLAPGLIRSASPDWQFATFDRIASHRRPGETDAYRVVELKYVRWFNEKWGDDGTDMIPDGYSIQTTWEHAVAKSRYPSRHLLTPHLAALDSSGEQRVFNVPYSERLAALLFEIASEFWQRVLRREEVGPDWKHPLSERLAAEIGEVRANTTVRLDDAALEQVERMEEAADAKHAAEAEYKFRKSQVRALLGDAEVGILPDGRRVKQYAVAEKIIAPKPYLREARTDLRILGRGASRGPRQVAAEVVRTELPAKRTLMIEAGDEEIILPRKGNS